MSEIGIITDGGRRRRWSVAEKLRIVEGAEDQKRPQWSVFPDELMLEGGSTAVAADDSVTGNRTVREMENRIRERERQLGRKTMEVEILKEALDKSRAKASLCPVANESANGSSVIGDGERPCLRSR